MEAKIIQEPPTVILFGQTGAGKSYAANRIAGYSDEEGFGVGDTIQSETENFEKKTCCLNKDPRYPLTIIDSPGFEDNQNLSNSAIYKKFISFLYKYNMKFSMVIFCLELRPRVSKNDLDHIKGILSFLGKGAIRNIYIMLTRADALKPDEAEKMTKGYEEGLNKLLKEKMPDYREINTHLFIPYWSSPDIGHFLQAFYCTLVHLPPFEIKVNESQFLSFQNERMRNLINLLKKDAEEELNSTKSYETKRACQEKLKLIKIIETKPSDKFQKILELSQSCSFKYLRALGSYFCSTNKDFKRALINDVYGIMMKFNRGDKEIRLSRSEYAKVLEKVLKENLSSQICESLKKIVDETRPTRNIKLVDTTCDTNTNAANQFKKMVAIGTYSGAIGGMVASNITYVALFEGTSFFSFGFPAGFTVVEAGTAGAIGTISTISAAAVTGIGLGFVAVGLAISYAAWKRETLIEEIAKKVQENFFEDQKNQDCGLMKSLIQEACLLFLLSCEDDEDSS